MMKLQHAQQGFSFWSLSFYLFLLGFAVFNGLKLFPVYAESATIESAVRSLESDRLANYTSPMSVKSALFKRMSINNVTFVTHEDIAVIRENNNFVVDAEYEVRIPYFQNIDLLFSFEHHAVVRGD